MLRSFNIKSKLLAIIVLAGGADLVMAALLIMWSTPSGVQMTRDILSVPGIIQSLPQQVASLVPQISLPKLPELPPLGVLSGIGEPQSQPTPSGAGVGPMAIARPTKPALIAPTATPTPDPKGLLRYYYPGPTWIQMCETFPRQWAVWSCVGGTEHNFWVYLVSRGWLPTQEHRPTTGHTGWMRQVELLPSIAMFQTAISVRGPEFWRRAEAADKGCN